MASALHTKTTLRNSMMDQISPAIGASGLLRLYTDPQPVTADTALTTQVQLAELALSVTAFGAAASGQITANAIADDAAADATGTATWASLLTAAGVRIIDLSVGTVGADVNLNSTAIQAGARVSITSFTLNLVPN